MVSLYPLVTFGNNPTVASIDTPLHAFLPFPHVDHLHPDWAIALAASANGKQKMDEFNQEFGHTLAWLPWQRPGFELGMMLQRIVAQTPACDGVVLGGHGLFTWGETQRESYRSSITIIDQLGQFIERHGMEPGHKAFGGTKAGVRNECRQITAQIMPYQRGAISRKQQSIGSFSDAEPVLRCVNSAMPRSWRTLERSVRITSSATRSVRCHALRASFLSISATCPQRSASSIPSPAAPRSSPPCGRSHPPTPGSPSETVVALCSSLMNATPGGTSPSSSPSPEASIPRAGEHTYPHAPRRRQARR